MNFEQTHPSHFGYIPEMPKEEDYIFGVGEKPRKLITDPQFEIDLKERQSKYGEEPKPEWISFEDKEPEPYQAIYWLHKCGSILKWSVYGGRPTKSTHWCDAKEFDERIALWNYHQKKYMNWGCRNYSHVILKATNGTHIILFNLLDETMEIYETNDIEDKLIYQGAILSTTTLEGIFNDNDIKL